MKEVIIHAGFQKTATSSIQKTCHKNREKLKDAGFYYPVFKLKDLRIINHSLPFWTLFLETEEKQYPLHASVNLENHEAKQIYSEQLDELLSYDYDSKIIISGESICALKESELKALKTKIESYNCRIRIFICIRSPFSFRSSMIQENIKHDSYPKSANGITMISKIESVISAFPDAEFYSFKEACKHSSGPVGFFLEKAGVEDYSTFDLFKSNESFSLKAIRLMSFINERSPTYIGNRINPFRSLYDIRVFDVIQGEKFQLNQQELNIFRDTIDRENEYLLNEFSAEFCDRIPESHESKENFPWSDTQINQLKSALFQVNDHIKIIVYDYCKNIISLGSKKIAYIFSDLQFINSADYASKELKINKEYRSSNTETIVRSIASFEAGNKLYKQGDLEESITCYQQALNIKPDYTQPLFKLSEIYESQASWSEATKCYRRIVGLESDNHNAYLKLAKVLVKQDKAYGAIAAYSEAIELKSDLPARVYKDFGDVLMQNQNNIEAAIKVYQQAADKKEDWSASFYIKFADILLKHQLLDRAILYYQKGIKIKKDSPRFYVSLGDALHQKQELDKAIICYKKAIQLKQDYTSVYKRLGDIYQEQEQLDSAVYCYHKFLELKPEANHIYRYLGNIFSKQGKLEEAGKYYSLSNK